MLMTVDFKTVENTPDRYIPVDVRSPSEFRESTITGAVNIPLFTDAERALVGTVYKCEGKAPAVRLGVEYVSRRLPEMYADFEKLVQPRKKILIFCARGGMRSGAVGNFIASVGLPAARLDKGYKGYRKHVMKRLPELIASKDFVTLYGKTGTGKTQILHEMELTGHDVLDLERCANHRGSLLGSLGLGAQYSQKQFETYLYDALVKAGSGVVYTEGESRRIGKIYLPAELADRLEAGRKLLVEAEPSARVEIIKKDYMAGGFDRDETVAAMQKLVRYIGRERLAEYTAMLDAGAYDAVILELMLRYYDIVYNTPHKTYEHTFLNEDPKQTAAKIAAYITDSARLRYRV